MLFLSLQFLIWSISGVYMVVFDIDYIHGDDMVIEDQSVINNQPVDYKFSALLIEYPTAKYIELSHFMGSNVYRFTHQTKLGRVPVMLDASNGKKLPAINENMAIKVAEYYYQADEIVTEIVLLKDSAPAELSSRHLPAWRVNFNDFAHSTLYISAKSGKIVTRRHQFWRIFDFMFTFHVMDYEEGDPANWLLLWVALFSFLAVCSGMVLTYYRVIKGQLSKRKVNSSTNLKYSNNNEQDA